MYQYLPLPQYLLYFQLSISGNTRVQERLRDKGLPYLEVGDRTTKSVAEISSTVGDFKQTIIKSPKGGRYRKLLKIVDSYVKIVDTTIQHHPAIKPLAWVGFKTILQVSFDSLLSFPTFKEYLSHV